MNKKLFYTTPASRVFEVRLEGIMQANSPTPNAPGSDDNYNNYDGDF